MILNNRRQFMKAGASILVLPFTNLPTAFASSSDYGIVGNKAPELEVSHWIDSEGKLATKAFQLADHKNKYIFMEFWQSWCPGCHSHGFPNLKKISDAFSDNDSFVAIAIQTTFEGYDTNTLERVREIQEQYDLKIMMGHDAGEAPRGHPKTMVSYRSGGTPWAVLISPEGKVIFNDFSINAKSAINFLNKKLLSF